MSQEFFLPPSAHKALLDAILHPVADPASTPANQTDVTRPYLPIVRAGHARCLHGRCLAVPEAVMACVPHDHPLHRHLTVIDTTQSLAA